MKYSLARAFEVFVGLTLIVSAALKGYELSLFMMQISGYRLLPGGSELYAATLIVLAEAMLGAALIAGFAWRAAAHALTMLLLAAFSGIFMYGIVKRGIDECGCFGDFLQLPPAVTLGKNAALVLMLIGAIILRAIAKFRMTPSRRALMTASAFGVIALCALGAGAGIHVIEEGDKQAMASGPVLPDRPYARFRFSADGRAFDLGSGPYLVVWLSTTCPECKEAIAPIGELIELIPDLPPVVGLSLGDNRTIKDFRKETTPPFPTVLVPSRLFMDYVDVDPPRYTLIRDGRVVAQWDSNLPAPIELAEKIYQ